MSIDKIDGNFAVRNQQMITVITEERKKRFHIFDLTRKAPRNKQLINTNSMFEAHSVWGEDGFAAGKATLVEAKKICDILWDKSDGTGDMSIVDTLTGKIVHILPAMKK